MCFREMATIHDVAKRAGVAPITVSRVINNSGYASEETRRRVETAVAELGYVPSGPARSLRIKRTDSIALVLTDITNPFFTTVARGVEDVASEAGYTVTYCNTDEDEAKEQKNIDLLLRQQVDGILAGAGSEQSPTLSAIFKDIRCLSWYWIAACPMRTRMWCAAIPKRALTS